MAYSKQNLAKLVSTNFPGGTGIQIWSYVSADAIATVRAAGYISDAKAMGMKARDLVLVSDTNVPSMQWCIVITVNATTGVGDLSDGTVIAETNT